MTKSQRLGEIRRTATANGGKPLGKAGFESETGIREGDWFGKYWARWGDALVEAGFAPNQMNVAFEDEKHLDAYAKLARELGRLPVAAELRLKARGEPGFPSHNTFRRLGSKEVFTSKLLEYCRGREGYQEVARWCEQSLPKEEDSDDEGSAEEAEIGFVYLIRSGGFSKIGMTNSAGRREYELAIQLPENATKVHVIRTDDPRGIEAYRHKRFSAKRYNGEWFELNAADVRSFKRRKFM